MAEARILSTGDAIREGLTEVALKNPSVIFLAEGVADPAAVFGTIKDLPKHIGAERIIEMPVSENALCGVAIGAAMMGKRPVISFHRVEFVLLEHSEGTTLTVTETAARHPSAGAHGPAFALTLR